MRRVLAAMLTVAVCGLPSTVASADPSTPTGPFLTLLFSRTEVTAASNCAMDDTGIERLDTVVAPTLAALGIRPVGTIATGATRTDSFYCAHYSSTLGASWNLERELAHKYGWSFVSHTSTYAHGASDWEQSPTSIYDQTCGSRDRITAEGLPGAEGLLAWADNYVYAPAISTVDQCFDFNRIYGEPVTDRSSAVVDHTEWTRGIGGGSCNLPTQPCASYQGPHGMQTYRSPTAFSAYIANAQPDQWITLQSYVLVDGAVPGKWDCTSPDWHAHWTYDAERYCWNDYLSIVKSIPPNVVVTDPASVAKAWGRSLDTDAPGPLASISITPGTTLAHIGDVVPFTVAGRDAFGHDLGDVTATATLSIDGAASCDASSCTATAPGSYTVTADVGGVQSTATMIVVGGSVASLVLTAPPAASIGTTAAMSVEAFDADGNDLGDVTAAAALSIGPDGTCIDRKSTRLNSSHVSESRMPSSA